MHPSKGSSRFSGEAIRQCLPVVAAAKSSDVSDIGFVLRAKLRLYSCTRIKAAMSASRMSANDL